MNDIFFLIPTLLSSDDFGAQFVGLFILVNCAMGLGILAMLTLHLLREIFLHLDSMQTWGVAMVVERTKIDAHVEATMPPAGGPCEMLSLHIPDHFKITVERQGQRGDFYCSAQEFEAYAVGGRANILARESLGGRGLVIGQAKPAL